MTEAVMRETYVLGKTKPLICSVVWFYPLYPKYPFNPRKALLILVF